MKIRIIGSGLIGTSIGLKARLNGFSIEMVDVDERNARLAQDLMGSPGSEAPSIVIFSLPTSQLSLVINREFALYPNSIFMDVGSVKTKSQLTIDAIPSLAPQFCGSHPMAGRESGGPEAARGDLFEGRPWILCPSDETAEETYRGIRDFVLGLGADPIRMSAHDHDRTVASISHLPQLVSSLLARQLQRMSPERLALAGQGLRDTTRIAHSDPHLWREIISMNREEILPLLHLVQADLAELIGKFDDPSKIEDFIRSGNDGASLIPGKHGGRSRDYSYLPIVIEDKPGQLAALFDECAKVEVNVEDLTIEHSPGQFTGLISLALSAEDGEKLSRHLSAIGWKVHSLR